MPSPAGTPRTPRFRSLVSRLLLAVAPVALVVALLVGWVAAPLLQTPGAVTSAERDLTQVQRYQRLLTLVDRQSLHWSEYQYLPDGYLMGIRAQMRGVSEQIDSLQQEWHRPPAAASRAFAAYSQLEESAQTSIVAADSGERQASVGVLVRQVLPASEALRADLRRQLVSLSEPLAQRFSELAGNLQVSVLGRPLAHRLGVVRNEIQQSVVSASIEDLVIQEASGYAAVIVTGDPQNRDAVGLDALATRDLANLTELLTASGERSEVRVAAQLGRYHRQMTAAGETVRDLVRAGSRDRAALYFERRLDPILLDHLLPLVASRVSGDRDQLASEVTEVNALAARLRLEMLGAGALLILALVLPILLVGRSTVRPLRKIRQAAEEVTAGNLTARTGVTHRSEVGALAQAFDHMATQVEASRASLLSAAVLAAASDLILIVSGGTVRHANGAAGALLGLEPEDLVGRSVASLVHPDDLASVVEETADPDAPRSAVPARFARSGDWVPTEVAIADLQDDPDVRGVVLVVHDTTQRQQVEVELAAARDAAIDASRMKSDFLATMSHEIRTPMNGVIGLTDLLLTTDLDQRQQQYAQGVHGAGEALLAIINDILDFSKVEAGKLELEQLDFDLVQVVEEAAQLVADPARLKGVELVTHCAPAIPAGLRGDPSRIRQVLLNLISNAVKFTAEGEVVARVQLLEQDDDGVVVHVEVSDTGVGIASRHQHRLFEPFTQEDSSTTRQFGGTGLGLAISHRLVTAMGGTIGLESEEGIGSTFWFTLPLGLAMSPVPPPTVWSDRLTGHRALVVDDNKTNRLILTEQLGAWGVLADAVEDGATALRLLQAASASGTPYSLLLLDYWMPHMDGLELAGHVSGDPTLTDPLMVLLSSAPEVSRERAREVGIANILTKPVRRAQLHATLLDLHGRNEVATPTPTPAAAPGTRGHLLVVEDNDVNQMVAVGILGALGYSTEVAANGREALDAMARGEFAAVLMDCHMPVMDGYTATARIRELEGGSRHTPVIAMTAGASTEDRERCLASGMDDYLSKPVKPQLVGEVLDRWVGPAAAPTAVETPSPGSPGRTEPEPESSPELVLDLERVRMLQELETGENSFFEQLVESFARRVPQELDDIQRAVRDSNHDALVAAAHRLKGGALNLGALDVGAVCQALEDAGEEQAVRRAAALVEGLPPTVEAAVRALRAQVASSSLVALSVD